MPTLNGLLLEAYDRGREDARYGRLYKDSFTDYFKGLGLLPQYDNGWEAGRKERLTNAR